MGPIHSPNLFFTNCTHEILDVGLCEVLVVVVQQFAVDCGHCHKYINPWSFCAQELFPNLEGDRTQHSAEDSTAASRTLPPASTAGLLMMDAVASWGSLWTLGSAQHRQEVDCCPIQKASCELCILPRYKFLVIFCIKALKFLTSYIFISIRSV